MSDEALPPFLPVCETPELPRPTTMQRLAIASLAVVATLGLTAEAVPPDDTPAAAPVVAASHFVPLESHPALADRLKLIAVNVERNSIDHRGKVRTTRLAHIVMRSHPDIAVFVENEPVQEKALRHVMHKDYGFVSAGGKLATGRVTNVIAYKKSALELTGAHTYTSFAQLHPDRRAKKVQNPFALLKQKDEPGVTFAVAAEHDPFDRAAARAEARSRTVKQAKQTDEPMLVAGDFNSVFAARKQFVKAGLHSAVNAGTKQYRRLRLHIDQIFGDRGITFRHTRWSTRPGNTTDHHGMVITEASIPDSTD